jgi:CheY-like chemotaxis protein
LGLSTVHQIAENHGGFVLLGSKPGAGATFYVYLPAAATGGARPGEMAAGQGEAARGEGEWILLVDDEPSIRKLASAVLNRHGYRTMTAAEGQEGLKLFEQHQKKIRLVVSDLMMPRLDGAGMLRGLRELAPVLKSIVITGLAEDCRIAEARAAGADMILNKPFTADQLLSEVRSLIG